MISTLTRRSGGHSPGSLISTLCATALGLLALAASAPRAQAQLTAIQSWGAPSSFQLPLNNPPTYNVEDGYLYGCVADGGSAGFGGLYRIYPDGSGYQVLYEFQGGTDGGYPTGRLVLDIYNHSFYGTVATANNGANPGEIFRFDYQGLTVSPLFTFPADGSGGTQPAGLTLGDADTALYGTGANMVFHINLDGTGYQAALQDSNGNQIYYPTAPVMSTYGTAYAMTGNSSLVGFSYSSGSLTVTQTDLYSALGFYNNSFYGAPTVCASNGGLYGIAAFGGAHGVGGIWTLDGRTGTLTDVYDFTGGADGRIPFGDMSSDSAGNLYTVDLTTSGPNNLGLVQYNVNTSTLTTIGTWYDFLATRSAPNASTYFNPFGGSIYAISMGSGTYNDGALLELIVSLSGSLSSAPNAAGWETTQPTFNITGSGMTSVVYTLTTNGVAGTPVTVSGENAVVTFPSDGIYSIAYYGNNAFGSQTSGTTTEVNIDTTPPVTYEDSTDNWVFLDGTDATSGVAATYYSIDGGAQQTYTDVIQLPQDNSQHTVTYWSVDVAGNVENQNVATVDTRADTYVTAQDVAYSNLVSKTTLSATLNETDTDAPLANQTLSFSIGGTTVGTAVTNSSGQASLRAVLPNTLAAGANTLTVSFAGSATQRPSQDTSTVNVSPVTTYLLVTSYGSAAHPIEVGSTISPVRANLESNNGGSLAGYTINYAMNGSSIGSAVTASTNIASLPSYTITDSLPLGANTLTATFAGTSAISGSTGTATYYVGSTGTKLNPINRSGSKGSMIALAVTLTRNSDGAILSGKTVSFTFNGHTYTATTTASGIATVFVTLPGTKGTYTYGVSFAGTPYYRLTSNSAKITVTN